MNIQETTASFVRINHDPIKEDTTFSQQSQWIVTLNAERLNITERLILSD